MDPEKLNAKKFNDRDLEERLRILVSTVKDYAIFLMSPEGIIESWNAGAESLKGYKADEIIGRSFLKFYTQDDLDRKHPQHELELAKKNGRYEEEGWRIRKDGSRFWANIIITRLDDNEGNHIGFAKVTRDLTERRKAEEALRESEERFRLIIDSVKDYAIIMLDPTGHIISWNEGALRLKGWSAAEITGRHFSQFYYAEEVASGKCDYELNEAAITGRFEDEGWRVRKDGTKFWANVVITALRDHRGKLKGFAKVTRDLTERKRNEDKLRLAHQGLEKRVVERTQELERAIKSRDDFLSIASHELRTPLTSLKLQQQLIERQMVKTPDVGLSAEKTKEVTDLIGRQVSQLLRLVDDMLDVSRIATGRLKLHMHECELSDVVDKVLKSFSTQLQAARVETRVNLVEDLTIKCDFHRLDQVISNLLSNAIKYAHGSPIEITTYRDGVFATLSVKDHGPGVPVDSQDRIFERFERAVSANEASGLGLGLYISRQIIESHGGTIRLESQPGQGANFIISLPLDN